MKEAINYVSLTTGLYIIGNNLFDADMRGPAGVRDGEVFSYPEDLESLSTTADYMPSTGSPLAELFTDSIASEESMEDSHVDSFVDSAESGSDVSLDDGLDAELALPAEGVQPLAVSVALLPFDAGALGDDVEGNEESFTEADTSTDSVL